MRRVSLWLLIVAVACLGCGQYQTGDAFEISGTTSFFSDEKLFQDAVDRKKAGASSSVNGIISQLETGGMVLIGKSDGATLKIVEPVTGGAKVAIEGGKNSGKLGWVLSDALKHRAKKD